MTKQQRKLVFRSLYSHSTNEKWDLVYIHVRDTYKWEKEYDMIVDIFDRHKSKWVICADCSISGRTYDYWLTKILEIAYLWARELKAV